ncbi:MAG: response regulator transcription factor [Ferruginibacter sp.]
MNNLMEMKTKIAIADDHQLFLKSLSILVSGFENFEVVSEALNGKEMLEKIGSMKEQPDLLLMDVQMPVMDGVTATEKINAKYPAIKIVALSSKDDDITVINMIRAGCCAYLLKDIHPNELEKALQEIYEKGYYNADASNINYRRLIKKANHDEEISITERERTFLQLACSDLTYRQIADKMNLSERTIDGYRESLFAKMNVQSRVGMALEAVRRGVVSV